MILARVVGTVVATRKDPRLEGRKLLVLQLESPRGNSRHGSSARMAEDCKDSPVDTAIVGIVDSLDLDDPVRKEG